MDGDGVGVIESTANGSEAANQQPALGIYMQDSSDVTIENLTIANLYVHSSSSDTTLSSKSQYAIEDYDGHDNTITGDTIHDSQVGVYYRNDSSGQGANDSVDHDTFYNIDNPVNQTYQFAGGSTGPFFFDHNVVHDFENWDTTADAYHHDGVHCYTSETGGDPVHSVGNYYYDNKFQSGTGNGSRLHLILLPRREEAAQVRRPATTRPRTNYIFNNVLIDDTSGGISNGVIGADAGVNHVFNNTMIGASAAPGGPQLATIAGTPGEEFENNVLTTADQLIHATAGSFTSTSPDYNIYADGSVAGNTWNCSDAWESALSLWQSCIADAGDAHSSYVPSAELSSDGSPQGGSPVLGAGANLTALCVGPLEPLCADIDGQPRATTGPWAAGAFDGPDSGT